MHQKNTLEPKVRVLYGCNEVCTFLHFLNRPCLSEFYLLANIFYRLLLILMTLNDERLMNDWRLMNWSTQFKKWPTIHNSDDFTYLLKQAVLYKDRFEINEIQFLFRLIRSDWTKFDRKIRASGVAQNITSFRVIHFGQLIKCVKHTVINDLNFWIHTHPVYSPDFAILWLPSLLLPHNLSGNIIK